MGHVICFRCLSYGSFGSGCIARIRYTTYSWLPLIFTLIILGLTLFLIPHLRSEIRFNHPRAHLIRGFLMACSIHFGFYTLSVVPLAAAAILFATAPIFATIFSVILGRETIGPRRTIAIVVGFLGTIIVMRPSSELIDINMIYGIASSIFLALL